MGAPSYLDLLRDNRDFRRLWTGEIVSFLGDWFTTIALYTVVQDLSGSGRAVAAVLIGKTLPVFLVMPIAGPLIDRFDRRKLMIATDIARALCCIGLVAGHRLESLPLLYVVLVVQMGFSGVFLPARTAVIPELTRPEQLPVAMALSGGTWSVMLALGAALGGLAADLLGIDGAFVLDAGTYLLSAWLLWGLPALPPTRSERGDAGFVAGLRYLSRRPYLAAILSVKATMALSSGALVVLPMYGNGLFPSTAGARYTGLLYAMRGLGALVGSMGVRRVVGDRPRTMRALLPLGFVVTALPLIATAWAPTVWWASVGYLVAAVGNGVLWVFSGILAQHASDAAYRGRMFSLEYGMMTLVTAGASWIVGVTVDTGLSPRDALVWSGAAMALPLLGWTFALLGLGWLDRDD